MSQLNCNLNAAVQYTAKILTTNLPEKKKNPLGSQCKKILDSNEQALVNAVMKVGENFLTRCKPVGFSRRTVLHEVSK
jgi:hypothetical protein